MPPCVTQPGVGPPPGSDPARGRIRLLKVPPARLSQAVPKVLPARLKGQRAGVRAAGAEMGREGKRTKSRCQKKSVCHVSKGQRAGVRQWSKGQVSKSILVLTAGPLLSARLVSKSFAEAMRGPLPVGRQGLGSARDEVREGKQGLVITRGEMRGMER